MQCAQGHYTAEMVKTSSHAQTGYETWRCLTCDRVVQLNRTSDGGMYDVRDLQKSRFVEEEEKKRHAENIANLAEFATGRAEDEDIELDARRVVDWECQVCGASLVRPQKVTRTKTAWDVDVISMKSITCDVIVTCTECNKKSVLEGLDLNEVVTKTGSPPLKRMLADLERARSEASEKRAERAAEEAERAVADAKNRVVGGYIDRFIIMCVFGMVAFLVLSFQNSNEWHQTMSRLFVETQERSDLGFFRQQFLVVLYFILGTVTLIAGAAYTYILKHFEPYFSYFKWACLTGSGLSAVSLVVKVFRGSR